jgi:hypothetical protein
VFITLGSLNFNCNIVLVRNGKLLFQKFTHITNLTSCILTCLWNLESKHVMHEVDHPLHNTLQEDFVLQIDHVTIYRNTKAGSPPSERIYIYIYIYI